MVHTHTINQMLKIYKNWNTVRYQDKIWKHTAEFLYVLTYCFAAHMKMI